MNMRLLLRAMNEQPHTPEHGKRCMLTRAVSLHKGVLPPLEGYAQDEWEGSEHWPRTPVLHIAATSEKIIDLFRELLDPLGDDVRVFLKTQHGCYGHKMRQAMRGSIERIVLESTILDYEDFLLHDGWSSIAVQDLASTIEVRLPQSKMMVVYARQCDPFVDTLHRFDLHRLPTCPDLLPGQYGCTSEKCFEDQFEEICSDLEAD